MGTFQSTFVHLFRRRRSNMLGNNESQPENKISGGGTKVKSLKN